MVSSYGDSAFWRGNNEFILITLFSASLKTIEQKLTYSFSSYANLKLWPSGSSNANRKVRRSRFPCFLYLSLDKKISTIVQPMVLVDLSFDEQSLPILVLEREI